MSSLEASVIGHPFLKDMSQAHLKTLMQSAMQVEFAVDEVIFRDGDQANRFYLIESGKVVLEIPGRDRESDSELIEAIGAGDVLGWSWLFPPYHWHFDARAVEPTKAIFFYGTRLLDECEKDPGLGYDLMKRVAGILVHRLQSTRKRLLADLSA
jgi:CRP/FNR family cyclic AMP-dependent transcriptional regulator